MKFITPLSAEDRKRLEELRLESSSGRVRMRAHAILLSNKGFSINEIALIFSVDRDSVSAWISSWEDLGFEGLPDKARSGRPLALDEQEKERALELLRESPQSIHTVLEELAEETGKTVSPWTLKRLAKRAGLRLKRLRRSVKARRDDEAFGKAAKEIDRLKEQQRRGKIDLFFFDESGFCLEPSIPYAWQPEGKHTELPTQKGSCFNVLGFFQEDNHLEPFVFESSVNSDVVIACFDEFAKTIEKKTVVVIDNAPTHTSLAFQEKIKEWEKEGLFIKQLPAYSPELNLIEILWRFIKYLWMPFSAYRSFETLIDAVENILRGVGSKYRINFA